MNTKFVSRFLAATGVSVVLLSFGAGAIAQAAPKAPSIIIHSPNGGENYKTGDSILIKWVAPRFDPSVRVQLQLTDTSFDNPDNRRMIALITQSTDNSGKYLWEIPSYIPAGQYLLYALVNVDSGASQTLSSDFSDAAFTITSNQSSITSLTQASSKPSASITSARSTISLTPTISGRASELSQVGIAIAASSGDKIYGSGLISVTDSKWSVTVSPALVAGQYTIYVYDTDNNQLTSGNLTVRAF